MNKLEFRLYYDDNGKVITYTSEKLEGKYIVITPQQYAEARHDVLVIDGKLSYTHVPTFIWKLSKNQVNGTRVSKYDVNVIVNDNEDGIFWMPVRHDFT